MTARTAATRYARHLRRHETQHDDDRERPQAHREGDEIRGRKPSGKTADLRDDARAAPAEAEQLGQLAHHDDERDPVHVAHTDGTGQELGDEAEPGERDDQSHPANHESEHPGQRDPGPGVRARERDHSGGYQGSGGRVRPHREHP